MIYYHLSTSGEVTKMVHKGNVGKSIGDFSSRDLNPQYDCDVYMHCVSDDDLSIFLLMHNDNDFSDNLRKSTLPVNKSLQTYFPTSVYVGDMILLVTSDDDVLFEGDWPVDVLRDYQFDDHQGDPYEHRLFVRIDD